MNETENSFVSKLRKLLQMSRQKLKEYINERIIQTMTKRRATALATLTVMVMQMFSPYGILLSTVDAAVDPQTNTLTVVSASEIKEASDGSKFVEVTLALTGENFNSIDFNIGYDATKIRPVYFDEPETESTEVNIKNNCAVIPDGRKDVPTELQWDTTSLSASEQTIRITASHSSGGVINLTTENAGKKENEWGYAPYYPCIKLYFGLVDSSITQLTTDMLYWKPNGNGMPTGYKYVYNNGSGDQTTINTKAVAYKGFVEAIKVVDSITIKTLPTKLTYNNGDTLDFTGGVITINYEQGDPEDINIVDALANGSLTVDATSALDTARKVTFTYSGKTVDMPYYTLSGATLKTPPSNTTYNHGDTINFDGGEIELEYTDSTGATTTETLSIPSEIDSGDITASTTTANVKKNPVELNYKGYKVEVPITVNDPIDHIAVTKSPDKVIYDHGEGISFAGGEITVYRKSGENSQVISSTDPKITLGVVSADIGSTKNKWEVTGGNGIEAGTQEITVTYEGKSTSYDITVNDTIDSIEVTKQPTAQNKFGTTNLDFSGMEVTVTTAGGGSFIVNNNSVNIDTSSYNNESLQMQEFPVSYGGKTATTKAQITLVDYIIDITPSFTTTSFDYNTPIATVVTGATYVKNYASGATSSPAEPITSSMVSKYNGTPLKGLFDANHEYTYPIDITLSSGTNSFDEVPITKKQNITIKDTITGIEIEQLPSKTSFEYGDDFEQTHGKVKTKYASGAEGNTIYMSDSTISLTETDKTAINMSPAKDTFENGVSTKEILVTYTNNGKTYTTTYNIKINDRIISIAIDEEPTKEFLHGDPFSVGNGSLTVTYAATGPKTIPMTSSGVRVKQVGGDKIDMSPTTYSTDQTYKEDLEISYQGATTTYDITIINDIKSISVHTKPKDKYNVKDPLDITGGEISVERAVQTENEIISMSDSKVSVTGFDSTSENTQLPLTVSYTENGITKTTSYDVEIKDSVISITITSSPQKVKVGEELDLSEITIDAVKGSGTTHPTINAGMISGFNKDKVGTQTVEVNYGGQTDTFTVEVQDYVTGITLNKTEVNGVKGTALSKLISDNNIEYTVTYAKAGAQSPVALATNMVTGYSETAIQDQNLTITYTDNDTNSFTKGDPFTANLKVKFQNTVTEVSITVPTKKTYNHGESIDLTLENINLTYANGDTETLPLSDATITELDGSTLNMSPTSYDSTNKVSKTVKITYTDKDGATDTQNYTFEIINDIKSITVHTKPKDKYNVKDPLDITGGEISVERAVQTENEIISMSDSKVSVTGFSSTSENTQLPLTVSYTENGITKKTSYNVEVKDSVTSITITSSPQKVKVGEELDLSGITIDAVKGSGTTHPAVNAGMISNFNKEQVGSQTVTVTYGGQTDTFTVEVQDYVEKITVNPASVTGNYNTELSDLISDNNITYTVHYKSAGAKSPVALADTMVTGYSKTSLSTQNLTVTYTDNDANSFTNGDPFTATLTVELSDKVTSVTVTGTANKTAYNYAEPLDLDGVTITVDYISGTKTVPLTDSSIVVTDITDGISGAPSATTSLPKTVFTSSNTVTRTIRVCYKADETHEDHVDFSITVLNTLDHIEIVTTPKDSYELNDVTANAGGTIKIYRSADTENTTEIIDITDSMITGLDTSSVGKNFTATVTYKEDDAHGAKITKTDTYNYDVTDTVVSITLSPGPDKTDYEYGDPIDLTGAYIDVVKANGTTEHILVTEEMISGFDSTPNYQTTTFPVTQTIKVTYGEHADGTPAETTFTVTVSDKVSGIKFNKPDKEEYNYNEPLDLTGGSIQKVMVSGAPTTPMALQDLLDDNLITISGYDATKAGSQTVTITYEGKTYTFAVTVVDEVTSIRIVDTPEQNYKYGDKLNVTGGTIEVTRNSGKIEIIPITNSMISGYNPKQLGPQLLTVTYEGQTDTYNVNVENYIAKIEITKPKKLVYNIGDTIVLDEGATVTPIMADGTKLTPIAMTEDMISGFNTNSEGPRTVTVTYEGKTATFSISVVDPLSSVRIKTLPKKLDYLYGENLDLTGGTLEIAKLSGASETINMTSDMVSGYNPKQLGEQRITVTYMGTTNEFIINVEDYISKLNVKAPNKVEYEYGEELDLSGGKVSIVMASGKVEEDVPMTASMVSGFDKTKEGTQTIKLEYKGLQGSFQVKVIDKIKGISLNTQPNKVNYKYGENLNVTGATIAVVKTSGIHIVEVTKDMVSGYNAKRPGTQVITVNYGEFTTEFIVTVAKKVQTTKPSTPSNNVPVEQPPVVEEPTVVEQPPVQKPIVEQPQVQEPIVEKPQQPEKPTAVLGVKDENSNDSGKILAGCIAGLGLLFLILLIVFRRNVKIYVFEDGEFVLGGKANISKKNPSLNIDKFLDEDTYPNPVKIRLYDSISEKLDGKEIEITHREKQIKHKVKYNDEEYEFILD